MLPKILLKACWCTQRDTKTTVKYCKNTSILRRRNLPLLQGKGKKKKKKVSVVYMHMRLAFGTELFISLRFVFHLSNDFLKYQYILVLTN